MTSLPEAKEKHKPGRPAFLFNGDADGLISQHLLYLSGLRPGLRLTGLKRDTALLARLPSDFPHDAHALDLGLKINADAAQAFLSRPGGLLFWYDHHESGPLPASPRFTAHIHPTPGQCTGLIVNAVLGHRFDAWAAAAAFGDNMTDSAKAVLKRLHLSAKDIADDRTDLQALGELLNYNAYGEDGDSLYHPADLARSMEAFSDPLAFYRDSGLFADLAAQLLADEGEAGSLDAWKTRGQARVYRVPNAAWARRYGATWMNRLIRSHPGQAFAIFQARTQGGYQVSLRAPQNGPGSAWSAAAFAERYPTGGGRVQAAGINALPEAMLEDCANAFLRELAG